MSDWSPDEDSVLLSSMTRSGEHANSLLPHRTYAEVMARRDQLRELRSGPVRVSRSGIPYREHVFPVHATYSASGGHVVISLPALACQADWTPSGSVDR